MELNPIPGIDIDRYTNLRESLETGYGRQWFDSNNYVINTSCTNQPLNIGRSVSLPTPPVQKRCQYRTGKCNNTRAIRKNGQLHLLCEEHRTRANLNQQRLDRKKRSQKKEGKEGKFQVVPKRSKSKSVDYTSIVDTIPHFSSKQTIQPTDYRKAPEEFPDEDLWILSNILGMTTVPKIIRRPMDALRQSI